MNRGAYGTNNIYTTPTQPPTRKKKRKWNSSEYGYKIINPIPRVLGDTLRNPRQTPNLMLLQLDIAIKHPILELLQERHLIQMHLHREETVFQRRSHSRDVALISRRRTIRPRRRRIKERAILWDVFTYHSHLVDIVCFGEGVVTFGIETADGREEFRALFFGEFGVEGVDGDVDGAAVGFELEDAGHVVGGGAAEGETVVVEVFEVGFVEGVADDFDVEVVEVGGGEAVAEVGS